MRSRAQHLGACDRAPARCVMPSQPPTDFRLYPCNDLDVLAAVLGELLRAPADGDWWREEWVLVPQFSMRRWLQQSLAGRLGICANVRFVTPGEFVELVLDANLGPAPRADRLRPDVLRWHLLRELGKDPPPDFAGFVAHADPRRRWSLATALADSFENYQAWRREQLLDWERRAPRDDAQAQLWKRIGSGRAHRARRIGEYLQRFGGEGLETPVGLPSRLFVFACQNISPDVLQVVASQARAGRQHFFLHTPSRAYWGDLDRWAADYRPDEDDRFGGENPLLAAWGQAGRDFIAALGSGDTVRAAFETTAFTQPHGDTLLGRIQADVLENRAPLSAAPANEPWPRKEVDAADGSLQFHACHTRLREVQVLHDQLRALLDAEAAAGRERIEPRDIAVLMPDVDAYAAHVEAVFGGALGTSREIPYTIADTSPLASAAIAEAFLRLLKLPLQPLTLPDVVDLMAVPALAGRFEIDDADRARLQDWLQAAGARWGLDAADRARHDAGDDGSYTFEFALDRLLLGIASGEDDMIAGVAPWPELEGQATQSLDALVRLLAAVRSFGARLQGPHTPREWSNQLADMIAAVFDAEPRDNAERAVLERLHQAVTEFADSALQAGFEQPVAHSVVLDHFQAELASGDARAPFLSGGVCFGKMVPMRLIPFRVLCVLGMEEAAFPARDGRDPVNRINQALDGKQRRVGDPSRRDADRYLFLQLFSSASRVFYSSWVGMDARDGSRREPSMLVSELLDAAARYHDGAAEDIRERLVVRHALQPFSPAAFGAALPDEIARRAAPFQLRRALASGGRRRHRAWRARRLRLAVARARFGDRRHRVARATARRADAPARALPAARPRPAPAGRGSHARRTRTLRHARRAVAPWIAAARVRRLAPCRCSARVARPAAATARARTARARRGWLGGVARHRRGSRAVRRNGVGRPASSVPANRTRSNCRCRTDRLVGTLDQVHPQGVFRAALNPTGRHGGHALRHGLDWLVASAHGWSLHELFLEEEAAPPRIVVRDPLVAGAGAQRPCPPCSRCGDAA